MREFEDWRDEVKGPQQSSVPEVTGAILGVGGSRVYVREEPARSGGVLSKKLDEVEEQLKGLDRDMKELYQRLEPVLRPACPTPCNPDCVSESQEQESDVVRVLSRWVRELGDARGFVHEVIDRCDV